jgi:SSS family solute:Na+ symporter/sodium/pantothenate symporter
VSSWGPLLVLFAVIAASLWLGTAAQRAVEKGSFLKGYFLGNRGLGVWALALTATVQSGGTFMGFPALVYKNGWSVALWIAGYMILPITAFAVLGKRLAQVSRATGALTVPDFLRERFRMPALGLAASVLIVGFMTLFMLAQFKAGGVLMQIAWPGSAGLALSEDATVSNLAAYRTGLAVFTVAVVVYTLVGGFLGAVWTDLLQSVLMLIGVAILFFLVLAASGGPEAATRTAMEKAGPGYAFPPGGPAEKPFCTFSIAVSMFFFWVFSGMGIPASLVRVMATKDSATLRRSVVALNVYNVLIYLPLILIAIMGRSGNLFPDLKAADEIIPRLALKTTADLPGGTFIAGLVLAAPFGAVMATVSTFLVVIASGVVRDIFQRFLRPDADERTLKWMTRGVLIVVGVVSVLASLNPVTNLQTLIVIGGGGAAGSFLVATAMALYWRRATGAGALAAMLTGAGTVVVLNLGDPSWRLGYDPFLWAMALSGAAGVAVSLATKPPDPALVSRLFDDQRSTSATSAQ